MATKRKRGNTWHYVVRRKGLLPKPAYFSFTDETEGDAFVSRLEALLDRGIVPDELKRPDKPVEILSDLIRAYLQAYAVSGSDRAILEATQHNTRTTDITFAWAESLVADLKSQLLAPGTIRHRVGALARCLDWAVRRGSIASNPLRMLPRGYSTYQRGEVTDQSRDRRLEHGEEDAIRRVLAGGFVPEDKQRPLELEYRASLVLMFDLALETAMRMREMYTLERRQVDIERRTIFLERTKNGDKRQVPLSTVAISALDGRVSGDGLLLPFFDGHLGRTTSRLSRLWGRVFDHAGCPDLRFHDLRHEATARFFERTTLSDLEISSITGHKEMRMLKRYANLRASNLARALW